MATMTTPVAAGSHRRAYRHAGPLFPRRRGNAAVRVRGPANFREEPARHKHGIRCLERSFP
jgi:hypothetical protein